MTLNTSPSGGGGVIYHYQYQTTQQILSTQNCRFRGYYQPVEQTLFRAVVAATPSTMDKGLVFEI